MGLIRIAVNAVALLAAGLIVPGIEIAWSDDAAGIAITLLVLAVIFGLVNTSIGRTARLVSIPLNILTLGLFHVVINALMLWITSWITDHTTHWGLHIDKFWWTAIWAALLLSLVSWVLSGPFRSAERALG